MNAKDWQTIKELFSVALDKSEDERASFLADVDETFALRLKHSFRTTPQPNVS